MIAIASNSLLINFENVFDDSFHTYKVFRNLKFEAVGIRLGSSPKTIWQILNHLISWQKHQLNLLAAFNDTPFCEADSWIEEMEPTSQLELDKAIKIFNEQISQFKFETKRINVTVLFLEQKLKAIQDASTHLAFHLGEIIHMLRLLGEYPMPDQMKEFLAS